MGAENPNLPLHCSPSNSMVTTWRRAQRKSAIIQALYIHRDLIMTLTDAIIVLLLAEKIHGTDAAIRTSAKNVAKKLPRSKRSIMYDIAESKSPRDLLQHIALGLDD